MSEPLAFFFTVSAYGARLPGDPRGTSLRRFNATPFSAPEPANALREQTARAAMKNPSPAFGRMEREVIAASLLEACLHYGWSLHAVNVRTNHVHAVLTTARDAEFAMRALKSSATRRLREAGLFGPEDRIWARHGSTRYLWDEQDVLNAVAYVLEGQGPDLQ